MLEYKILLEKHSCEIEVQANVSTKERKLQTLVHEPEEPSDLLSRHLAYLSLANTLRVLNLNQNPGKLVRGAVLFQT
jgi:hypothetical protein